MKTTPPSLDVSQTVMIVAGEASGDLHGSRLVQAMLAKNPTLRFCGMGGRELTQSGVEILYDAAKLAVVGITEIISHLSDIIAARQVLVRRLKKQRPSLLILIDYPDFNLHLAAKAKQLGIPILYYISPQVWAWRSGRVKKIGRLADRIAVILPFEQEFYQKRGVTVDFVGHPLLDSVQTSVDRKEFCQKQYIPFTQKIIGLLPGSRSKEISSLLPDFLQAAVLLNELSNTDHCYIIPRASTIPRSLLEDNGVNQFRDRLDIRIIEDQRYDIMKACDAVVAASGTVTLELAILGTPLIATYRVSPRTYFLGRLLVKLPFFSLINLVADHQVIPELLQDEVSPENIAHLLHQILTNKELRAKMIAGLAETRDKLGAAGASARVAEIGLSLMGMSDES